MNFNFEVCGEWISFKRLEKSERVIRSEPREQRRSIERDEWNCAIKSPILLRLGHKEHVHQDREKFGIPFWFSWLLCSIVNSDCIMFIKRISRSRLLVLTNPLLGCAPPPTSIQNRGGVFNASVTYRINYFFLALLRHRFYLSDDSGTIQPPNTTDSGQDGLQSIIRPWHGAFDSVDHLPLHHPSPTWAVVLYMMTS